MYRQNFYNARVTITNGQWKRAHYKYIFYIFIQGTYDYYSQLLSFENKTVFSYILRAFRSAWKDKILLDARSKSD